MFCLIFYINILTQQSDFKSSFIMLTINGLGVNDGEYNPSADKEVGLPDKDCESNVRTEVSNTRPAKGSNVNCEHQEIEVFK
jgi:hypothetical protein